MDFLKLKYCILFLLSLHGLVAQEIKFGKVTKDEVSATHHARYPNAHAAILYKGELVSFDFDDKRGWRQIIEVHYRVKIYNKQGFNWASLQTLLLTDGGNRQDISKISGFTFNIIDGKIIKSQLENEGIIIEKVDENLKRVSITLPDVKEGSVLEFKYVIESPVNRNIDEFWFQFEIPVDYAMVQLKIPEYFVYKQYNRGFFPIEFERSQENRSINATSQTTYTIKKSSNVSIGKETLKFVENVFTFSSSNLPGLVKESQVFNLSDYRSSIQFKLMSTRFPDEPEKDYSASWEDVAKSIYKRESFGEELNRHDYFEEDLKQVVRGASTEKEKALAIFNFVKSKMNWDYSFGIRCNSKGIKEAYSTGIGNVADINLMLTAMFRNIGLRADPILISSTGNGIPLFPKSDAFNYVIVGLQLQDDLLLFDATEKYGCPDIIAMHAIHWVGRLIREDGTTAQVDLVPKHKSLNAELVTATLNEDGSITGRYRHQTTGYFALSLRKMNAANPGESYLDNIERKKTDHEISNFNVLNHDDSCKPLIQTYNFYQKAVFEEIEGKIYSNNLFTLNHINPFKEEERKLPIEKIFTQSFKKIVTIKIPDGYAVESLPEPVAIVLPQNIGSFKYELWVKEDIIKISSEVDWNTTVILPEHYAEVKEFYNRIANGYSGKLILAKS
nr:DUF3857 domain-containing protein [Allomuricauda sp.]